MKNIRKIIINTITPIIKPFYNRFSRMTDDTLNLNFEDWNKKIAPHVFTLNQSFFPVEDPKNSVKWNNLLTVANSEYLIEKNWEILKKYRKERVHKLQTSENEVVLKMAHIISGFHYISKQHDIPWVLIFEDVNTIAETFHTKLDFSLRYEQQIMILLVFYFRDVKIQVKNEHLRTILYKLAHSLTSQERKQVSESVAKYA